MEEALPKISESHIDPILDDRLKSLLGAIVSDDQAKLAEMLRRPDFDPDCLRDDERLRFNSKNCARVRNPQKLSLIHL